VTNGGAITLTAAHTTC